MKFGSVKKVASIYRWVEIQISTVIKSPGYQIDLMALGSYASKYSLGPKHLF